MVSEEVKAYVSSLADLTFNSKPLINMLTMLADENVAHATEIVEVVENHLNKVKTDVKLPILYLIDCIVKNVGGPYTELFSRNIVSTFCNVFKVVDEKTRAEMFKLRQTWNDVFSPKKLYAIDVQIRLLDPAWPVTAPLPSTGNIHINPKFFKTSTQGKPLVPVSTTDPLIDMQQQLLQKQKELLELQLKKSELELLQTKVQYREPLSGKVTIPQNVLLKPEVAKQLLSSSTSSKNEDKNVKSLNMKKVQIQPANSALVAAAVSRPVRDPRLLKQQQVQQQQSKNTSNINVHLENKNNNENSSNKIVNSKMSVRDDPRLKNNIVPSSTSSQQKFIDDKTKSRNLSKFRNSNKNPSSSSSSSNTSNSPSKKNKSDKTSPIKNSSSSTSTSSNRNKRKEAPSIDTKHFKSSSSRDLKQSKSDTFLTTVFKDVKTGKNRNFRRKHSPKFSPEPQDVDLRLIGNKDTTTNDKKHEPLIQPIDVDLRQLPIQLNKKRSSTESPERTTKKSKTELMDQLFGNEDTDLRPTMNDRPPTPPPPIISSTEKVDENESKLQKSNLDFVRAKLAANIKKTSPVNKSIKKRSDEDIRVNKVSSSTDIKKIGISKAECDKIIEGGMTSIQQNEIMNKIIAQIEAQKLKEAKKNDLIETTTVNNVSLTPISDEELDFIDENGERRKEIPSLFGDKDERIIPMQMLPDEFSTNKRFARENRRGLPSWRNTRGAPNTTRRFWDTSRQQQQQQQRPWMNNWTGNFRPPFPEVDRNEIRSPDNDIVVESSSQEDIKTITIDGSPRDIRYYDEIAIIFLNWDDPREISFQDGTRRVIFNDANMYMLNFNEPYREYRIDDDLYQVKLGGPSREIYIDYKPYECYFGGPGITIDLKGKVTTIKLDGPPPQVKIGEPRTDLVAGKIKLIIDAKTIVPIFVDSKLQKFIFNDEEHTVQLNPGLKTVNINNELFDVQFGGLPKPINLKGKKHYIRFSVLPKNVKPGMVKIKGLENDDRPLSPNLDDLNTNEPALPIPQRVIKAYDSNLSPDNSSSGTLFQNVLQQQNLSNLDFLTNVISSSSGQTTNSSSYQIENNTPTPLVENTNTTNDNSFGSINDLFQKLVASGILTTTPSSTSITNKEQTVTQPPQQQQQQYQNKEKSKSNKFRRNVPLKPVTFNKPEQLKVRQGILYEKLYSGMQCSSCGMRFPPEQSMYYSQHLDWHFRQNRKGKKNARVASSRKWYYTVSDWQKYEEIENLEEREKNYFDQQQQQAENSTETKKEETELQSVTADPELQDICEVCGDKFDIFFNEDKEEWQFKNAIKDEEDKIYHPICYEEHQQSLLNMLNDEDIPASPSQIPGIEIPNEDENIDEVVLDESEESQNEETSPTTPEYIDEDDDVILKEPTIEEIIVDDDDDFNDIGEETQQTIPSISSPKLSPKIKEIVENLDDGFVDVNEGLAMLQNGGPPIQVKTEPIDEDDLPNDEEMFEASSSSLIDESSVIVENQDDELKETEVEQSRTSFVPSIDGNLEMESSATHPVNSVSGKIKININKPLPVIAPKDNINKDLNKCDTIHERLIDPSQPLPPGEEPVIIQQRKPSLQGIELKDMPPVQRGTEVTGMCSIM